MPAKEDGHNFDVINQYLKVRDMSETELAAMETFQDLLLCPHPSSPSYTTQDVQQVLSSLPTSVSTTSAPSSLCPTTGTTTTAGTNSRRVPAFLRSDSEVCVQNIKMALMTAEAETKPMPIHPQSTFHNLHLAPLGSTSAAATTTSNAVNNSNSHCHTFVVEAATAGCTVVDKQSELADHRLGEAMDFGDLCGNWDMSNTFYDDRCSKADGVVKMEPVSQSPEWTADSSWPQSGLAWVENTELVPAATTGHDDEVLEHVLDCIDRNTLGIRFFSEFQEMTPLQQQEQHHPHQQQQHQQQQQQQVNQQQHPSFITLTNVSNLTSPADARMTPYQPSVTPQPSQVPPSVSPAPSTGSVSSVQSSLSRSSPEPSMFLSQESSVASEDDLMFLESLADFSQSDLPQSVTPTRPPPSPSPSTTSSTSSSTSSCPQQRSPTRHGKQIRLWEFLKELLDSNDPSMKWIDRATGIFKIEKSNDVAFLWGKRKNHPAMNYDKLSRSIRQYYKKNIIKKTGSPKRLIYQFCKVNW